MDKFTFTVVKHNFFYNKEIHMYVYNLIVLFTISGTFKTI